MKKVWLVSICLMLLAGCDKPPPKRSEMPVVIRAQFMDNSCGPTGAHIKLLEETLPAASGEQLDYGFQFFSAEGIRTPDDPEWAHAVNGNTYELEGYYYYHIEYGRRILESRFDLLGWRLLAPYTMADGSVQEGGEAFSEYWDQPKKDPTVFQLSRTYNTDCKQ